MGDLVCPNCGSREEGDSLFCSECGAPLGGARREAAAEPTQRQPQVAPRPAPSTMAPRPAQTAAPPTTPMAPAAAGPPEKPGRNWVPLLIGAIALLVVAIVVVVLVFTVFKGGNETDSGKLTDVVEDFYAAIEEKDIDSIIALIDPEIIDELEKELGDGYEELLEGYFLKGVQENAGFSNLKFETEVEGDEATVYIIEGTFTYIEPGGEKQEIDVTEKDGMYETLVKRDGKWYVSISDYDLSFADGDKEKGEEEEKEDGKKTSCGTTYENKQLGYSFEYPEDWSVDEYPDEGLVETHPRDETEMASVTIYTDDLEGLSMTLDELASLTTIMLDADGTLYDVESIELGGCPAKMVTYNVVGGDQVGYKMVDIYSIKDDIGYSISLITSDEDFKDDFSDLEVILESFKMP